MSAAPLLRAGLRLNVARQGAGPVMVFQHGLCGDAAQPAQVFPADAGLSLLTLECRGHGASEPGDPEKFGIATFADDVAALIARDAPAPVVLGGISMGAAIALRLAVTQPHLVRALVLARPAWGTDAAPANMAPNALAGRLLRAHDAATARALFEADPLAAWLAQVAPDNLASLRGFFDRAPQAVTAELLVRLSGDGPGITAADLGALRLPVLVIGHARDAVHPLALAQRLAAAIPGARLAEITPKATDPARYRDDFRTALADFLKGLPA